MKTYVKTETYVPYYKIWLEPGMLTDSYHVYEMFELYNHGYEDVRQYRGIVRTEDLAPYFEGWR